MVLGDAFSKLETFVWILNRISRSITWSLFTLKASYLVKWPISTLYFMWWCQFIDKLKFETRPNSPQFSDEFRNGQSCSAYKVYSTCTMCPSPLVLCNKTYILHSLSELPSLWTQTDFRLFSGNLSVFTGYELHGKIKILTIHWPWLFPKILQGVHLSNSQYPSDLSAPDESVLGHNYDRQLGYITFHYMVIWWKRW